MKRNHVIEIFSSNCPLCRQVIGDIEMGKCQGCEQIIYNINSMTEGLKTKMKVYGVKAVPTTVIDGSIKVVGISDFPWVCGDDLYERLKDDYSF